ncbi:hypothetical protein EVAR_98473_1 [Eumeta japonica]|uniref:Uncharacterized protein n=1 Tax=Eumeta variegata TaxID=151549 RepID=A0A4C1SV90_EUMVA|nr:hypothetical protein EVAR_98473_1 [Eumeta japonica]
MEKESYGERGLEKAAGDLTEKGFQSMILNRATIASNRKVNEFMNTTNINVIYTTTTEYAERPVESVSHSKAFTVQNVVGRARRTAIHTAAPAAPSAQPKQLGRIPPVQRNMLISTGFVKAITLKDKNCHGDLVHTTLLARSSPNPRRLNAAP